MTVAMTQKSAKKKSKKSSNAAGDSSVLGSLRSTRPTRLGGDRRGRATTSRAATATKPKAAKPAKRAKAKPKAVKPATTAQTKAAAQRPAPPPADGRPGGPPRGAEIVTTAVQAAGELAQIGVTVGTQLLRRAARRIPRP
jgi:hypothetical protein